MQAGAGAFKRPERSGGARPAEGIHCPHCDGVLDLKGLLAEAALKGIKI